MVRHQGSGAFKSRFVSCLQTQDKDVTVMPDVWYNRNILTRTKIRMEVKDSNGSDSMEVKHGQPSKAMFTVLKYFTSDA